MGFFSVVCFCVQKEYLNSHCVPSAKVWFLMQQFKKEKEAAFSCSWQKPGFVSWLSCGSFSGAWDKKRSAIRTTRSCYCYCLKCWVVKPKLKQHAPSLLLLLLYQLNRTEEEEEPGCDTEGTQTSVSHELRGAALAFTGCVIFLQAFHNVNSEPFLLPRGGIGGSRNLSHAQTF